MHLFQVLQAKPHFANITKARLRKKRVGALDQHARSLYLSPSWEYMGKVLGGRKVKTLRLHILRFETHFMFLGGEQQQQH